MRVRGVAEQGAMPVRVTILRELTRLGGVATHRERNAVLLNDYLAIHTSQWKYKLNGNIAGNTS
jgi:hypothetical protein